MALASSTPPSTPCELCRAPANVLCPSDDACLCWRCDCVVHSANFLVARHRRAILCRSCSNPTAFVATGARLAPDSRVCSRCLAGAVEACCSGGSDCESSGVTECESEAEVMSDASGVEAAGICAGRRGKRVSEMSGGCKRRLRGRYGTAQEAVSDAGSGIDDEVSAVEGDDASSPVRATAGDDVADNVFRTGRGCRDMPEA